MIPLALFLAFVMASALLLLFPGPNVALIASNSIAHGSRAVFLRPKGHVRNQLQGGLLIGAAAGLALARKS